MELNTKGLGLHNEKKDREAVAVFANALEIAPDSNVIHYNLACSLMGLGQYAGAVDHYQRAFELGMRIPEVPNNTGLALDQLERYAEAALSYQGALEINPSYAPAHENLGYLFLKTGEMQKAVISLREAIRLDPQNARAHWLLSHALLQLGEFAEGFREYEWRWKQPEFAAYRRDFAQPRWQGEDLSGKTILLWNEQGLGDALQFIRFAAAVKERGGRVVLECQQGLARILKTADGVDEVVAKGAPLPRFDVQCPLPSLPLVLGTTPGSIPARVPYLAVDPIIAERWKERISHDRAFKVGAVWAGNPNHPNDGLRSIRPDFFRLLCNLSGLSIYSLQKGAEGALPMQPPFVDYSPELSDFAETGGLVQALDLVITVDTAAAHLAGALSKNVWLLLPYNPDWRWLPGRTDSPWYPTMRVFRQPRRGDWTSVFKKAAEELFVISTKA